MGCMGDREKGPADETAKWDFITLSDFKCTSAWTYTAYVWLWMMTTIGVAVYVVDTYTAVNLLVYDRWSSQIQPVVPIKYSKWIFAVCILLSWALCVYEWFRAIRVIRRRGVAESFLDPLAVTLLSIRPNGGWKHFLVFTELTKSKKGADYVALFTYFSFKGALRVILAEGPRQVVNGMTLWALLQAKLVPTQPTSRDSFDQFWFNVQQVADSNPEQAVLYCGMLFTLVIWVFSALSLLTAFVMYVVFLWHYIPQRDGRLNVYCRRKIDRRLAKIVEHKVKAALEKEERKKEKAIQKAEVQARKAGLEPPSVQPHLKKQPTLPNIGDASASPMQEDEKLSEFPLSRQDTNATVRTLPPYLARSATRNENLPRQPTLPMIDTGDRPGMMRSGTQRSNWSATPSYSTDAPLLANAGYGGSAEDMPLPPSAISRQDSYASFRPFHGRTDSQSTQGSRRPFTPGPGPFVGPGSRAQTPMSARPFTPNNPSFRALPGPQMPPPVRSNTGLSFDAPQSASSNPAQPFRPPPRSNTADSFRSHQTSDSSYSGVSSQRSFSRPINTGPQGGFRPYTPAAPTVPEIRSPSPESFEMQPQPSHNAPVQGAYAAFQPSEQSVAPTPRPQTAMNAAGAQSTGTPDYFSNSHHLAPTPSNSAGMHSERSSAVSAYANNILDLYGSDDEGSKRLTPRS